MRASIAAALALLACLVATRSAPAAAASEPTAPPGVSVRAACAQLAPEVEPQAAPVLATLASLGIEIRHDELCIVP